MRPQAALAEAAAGARAASAGVAAEVAGEASAAVDAVAALRGELARQLPPGQLRAIEAKLAALEGSVLSAGAAPVCSVHSRAAPCAWGCCRASCQQIKPQQRL